MGWGKSLKKAARAVTAPTAALAVAVNKTGVYTNNVLASVVPEEYESQVLKIGEAMQASSGQVLKITGNADKLIGEKKSGTAVIDNGAIPIVSDTPSYISTDYIRTKSGLEPVSGRVSAGSSQNAIGNNSYLMLGSVGLLALVLLTRK